MKRNSIHNFMWIQSTKKTAMSWIQIHLKLETDGILQTVTLKLTLTFKTTKLYQTQYIHAFLRTLFHHVCLHMNVWHSLKKYPHIRNTPTNQH